MPVPISTIRPPAPLLIRLVKAADLFGVDWDRLLFSSHVREWGPTSERTGASSFACDRPTAASLKALIFSPFAGQTGGLEPALATGGFTGGDAEPPADVSAVQTTAVIVLSVSTNFPNHGAMDFFTDSSLLIW